MIVMKFGGSSVANADRIKHVAEIIQAYKGERPVVVLSAMGDTTDHLLEAADMAVKGTVDIEKIEKLHIETEKQLGVSVPEIKELLGELKTLLTGISMLHELTKRTRDYLVSFGERMSVRMMSAYLCSLGIEAKAFDSWDIGFVSDSNYMAAELLDEVWENIPKHLGGYKSGTSNEIPIVTGFIAKDKNGIITTLGRGGSDLSATMIGAAMRAKEIQTWKDVDGIMTTDPRIVKEARPVDEVTYEEAQELAMFGSQVLHPRSMIPCRKTRTPVRNNGEIKSLSDLKGKKIGVQAGSSAQEAIDGAPDFKKSLKEIVEFKENVTALNDLEFGNLDGVVMDLVVAGYSITQGKKPLVILDETLAPEEYGIAFSRKNKSLRDKVQKTLLEMQADGTVAKISTKWFGSDISTIGK